MKYEAAITTQTREVDDIRGIVDPCGSRRETKARIEREYDELAEHYHLMFSDRTALSKREAAFVSQVIETKFGSSEAVRILVVACGPGTQALALAELGHEVTGCDLSPESIAIARREADLKGIHIRLDVADMRNLARMDSDGFDVVIVLGNSFCVLRSYEEIATTMRQIRMKMRAGGLFIAGLRDYRSAMAERPLYIDPPLVHFEAGKWRVVEEAWLWQGEMNYIAEIRINREGADVLKRSVHCRAVLPHEITKAFEEGGFSDIDWIRMPADGYPAQSVYVSGFDQIIVAARTRRPTMDRSSRNSTL